MKSTSSTVILVCSTSYALHIEKTLKDSGIPCTLIPVPRHLSSDCGVCVRIASHCKAKTIKMLETTKIPFEGIFDLIQ
ncbi:MAG: DUF3343 domain-containing protein [Spirochaetales bacterium]|nr:DUF3343 domain-containing protein [Spirochaetales bacterium]